MPLEDSRYVAVTLSKPVIWQRTPDETWMLNPRRPYVLNASAAQSLGDKVESISELHGLRSYRPLTASMLTGRPLKVLVERHRLRGVGDTLFMTGPLSYIKSIAPKSIIDFYGLTDRAELLASHPAIENGVVLAGPITTGDFEQYDAQWLVAAVTENVSQDQLNVYDALYLSLGLDPAGVPDVYKRPSICLTPADAADLTGFFYHVRSATRIDLRTSNYVVVAPLCNSSLRSAQYGMWLEVIKQLRETKTVVVIGHAHQQIPQTDMSFVEFTRAVDAIAAQGNVVNAMASSPARLMASIISKADAVATLDTGPLYVAQALRIPCVSLWGTHDPRSRLQYDKPYLANAIWNSQACPLSPCWAYAGWPSTCPDTRVHACLPLASVAPEAVVSAVLKSA